MKILIKKSILLASIKSTTNIVDHNNVNPMMASVRFQVNEDQLILTATNGSNAFQQKIKDLKIIEKGEFLIRGKLLFNIISKIACDEIELSKIDENLLQIKTPNFLCEINLVENDFFPIIDFDYSNWKKIIFSKKNIIDITKKILIFLPIFIDDKFNCINGIYFNTIDSNWIECIATNRIAVGYHKFEYSGDKVKFIIGMEAIKAINDVFSSQKKDSVEIYLTDKKAIFKVDDVLLSFSLFENCYPNITDKILAKQKYSFTIESASLLNALSQGSSLIVDDSKPIVDFVVSKSILEIKFNSIEVGNSIEKINLIDKDANSIDFKLNQKIIQQIIMSINSPTITFNYDGKNKPIIITSQNKDFLNLIMPFSNN